MPIRRSPEGRLIMTTSGKLSCKCCNCVRWYRCTLCNGECPGLPNFIVYLCTEFECEPGTPLENGQVIRSPAGYCYTVDTTTEYCEAGGEGCEPLPKGAIIISSVMECVEDCEAGNCPEVDCWVQAIPCSCNGDDPGGYEVYISYAAWQAATAAGLDCPTWMITHGGNPYCYFSRGTLINPPDPPNPNTYLITSAAAATNNCCQCCSNDFGEDCCYQEFEPYEITYNPTCGDITTEFFDEVICCGEKASYEITFEGTVTVEFDFGLGPRVTQITTWSGSGQYPDTYSGVTTNYDYTTGEVSSTTPFTENCPTACYIGNVHPFSDFPTGCGGTGSTQEGSITADCDSGGFNIVINNMPAGGSRQTWVGTYSISSTAGICGSEDCEPLDGGEDVAPLMMRMDSQVPESPSETEPKKQKRRGCSGCRRKKKEGTEGGIAEQRNAYLLFDGSRSI